MKRRSILTDNPPEALAQAAASAPSLGYSADREAGEALALAILDRCPPCAGSRDDLGRALICLMGLPEARSRKGLILGLASVFADHAFAVRQAGVTSSILHAHYGERRARRRALMAECAGDD